MAIYKYPYETPVPGNGAALDESPTQAIDYVCFQRQEMNYSDTDKGFGTGALSMPGNEFNVITHPDRVYLAMPPQLGTAYSVGYQGKNMGTLGMLAGQIASQTPLNETADGEDGGEAGKIAKALQDAAGAVAPEFISSAVANGISGANQFMGLGGGFDANDLQALTNGRIFNPYREQIFTGIGFRSHSFTFKLFARSPEEAREIKGIIDYFKKGSLPQITGTTDSDKKADRSSYSEGISSERADEIEGALNELSKNRYLKIPDKWDIKFIRVTTDANGNWSSPTLHFRTKISVLTQVGVNYTPDGQYNAFKHIQNEYVSSTGGNPTAIHVPAVTMQLAFQEAQLVTKDDINQGY